MKKLLLTVTTLAMVASGTPPEAWPLDPMGSELLPELTSQAAFSCQDLTLAGNSVVTSEGLGTGVEGDEGDVRSNANVRLKGSVEVHGDAIAGPDGEVILSGQPALVTGEMLSAAELLDCRPIDLAALAAELELSNDNDLLPRTDKGKKPFKKGRDFELKGNDGITLPTGTYLFDPLKITGNSEVRPDGEVRILVLGEIDVSGRIHAGGNPFELRLWSAGASVKLNSQSVVHGHLYAPDAAVKLAGGSTFGGSLFA
ncbi:MAG: hypothetical protein GY854_24950, partial [Deltaproteobacteria bacterium]|nr:hypothetical protein [Deltaproteobacteria bacterium]